MKVGDYVFCYGTLKQGFGANSFMQGRSDFIGDDRVNGRIYSLGGFPGFTQVAEPGAHFHHDGDTVTGEVYRITNPDLPRMLDNYEGYPNMYTRSQFRTEGGHTVWVYEYNGTLNDDRRVRDGVWEGSSYVSA